MECPDSHRYFENERREEKRGRPRKLAWDERRSSRRAAARAFESLALVAQHAANQLNEAGDGADDDAGYGQPVRMEEVVA